MNATQKFSLLTGTVWNLKRWIELKQWAKRSGDAVTLNNAEAGIARCRDTARKIRGLRTAEIFLPLSLGSSPQIAGGILR